jgi:23S rRNA pseudouridine1911/1915/1917 synthase
MHPTASYHKHTLSYLLRTRYAPDGGRSPQIAHRLDRETSGIVLCGCTRSSERKLKMAFEAHRVQKTYLAIVRGEVADDAMTIDFPLASAREGLHVRMEVRPEDGLPAHTELRVRERAGGHSLVELSPKTGRQHQLRVHLSAIGHSIVGDKLYGPELEAPFLEYIESGMTAELEARLGHDRHALHAHAVELEHPSDASPLRVVSPLPEDLRRLWQRLSGITAVDDASGK